MGFPSFSTLVWCPILTTVRWTSFTWVTRLPDTLHKMKFEVLTFGCDTVQSDSVLRSFSRAYHIYQSISVRTVDSQYLFLLFGIFGNNRTSEMSVKVTRLHGVTSKKTYYAFTWFNDLAVMKCKHLMFSWPCIVIYRYNDPANSH